MGSGRFFSETHLRTGSLGLLGPALLDFGTWGTALDRGGRGEDKLWDFGQH